MDMEKVKDHVESMTEEEATEYLVRMSTHFGWAGAIFTRTDIEDLHRNWHDELEEDDYTPLTEEQIDAVMSTRAWCKGIDERLCEEGFELLEIALDEIVRGQAQ